jgi:hypothetical protein
MAQDARIPTGARANFLKQPFLHGHKNRLMKSDGFYLFERSIKGTNLITVCIAL